MPTIIEHEQPELNIIAIIGLVVIVAALAHFIPNSIARDEERAKQKEIVAKDCGTFKDLVLSNVPARCMKFFNGNE